MTCLLYGIVFAGSGPHPGAPPPRLPPGVGGAPVRLIEAHGLGAAVSAIDASDRAPSVERALVYARVIEALHADRAIVPMRFGCTFAGEREMTDLLRVRRAEYVRVLHVVDGCVEMGVRILRPGPRVALSRSPRPTENVDERETTVPARSPGNEFPGSVGQSRLKPTVNGSLESPSETVDFLRDSPLRRGSGQASRRRQKRAAPQGERKNAYQFESNGSCTVRAEALEARSSHVSTVSADARGAGWASGAAYLNHRSAVYAEQDRRVLEATQVTDRLRAAVAGWFVRFKAAGPERGTPPTAGASVASAYFLVRRQALEAFCEAFRDFRRTEPASLRLSGPWPPYNFVVPGDINGRRSD